MIDKNWIKNLATAKFVSNQWHTDNPGEVEYQLSEKIDTVIDRLLKSALDAADSYNSFVHGERSICIMKIEDQANDKMIGIVVSRTNVQIKVLLSNHQIIIKRIQIKGFSKSSTTIYKLKPFYDGLGSLFWQTDRDQTLFNDEMISKLVLQELIKATH